MKAVLLILLALSVVAVSVAPAAVAAPPEVCGDVVSDAKCEQIREDLSDLLTCTCPPW